MVKVQNLGRLLTKIKFAAILLELTVKDTEKTTENIFYKIRFSTRQINNVQLQFDLRLSFKLALKKAYAERNGAADILFVNELNVTNRKKPHSYIAWPRNKEHL